MGCAKHFRKSFVKKSFKIVPFSPKYAIMKVVLAVDSTGYVRGFSRQVGLPNDPQEKES